VIVGQRPAWHGEGRIVHAGAPPGSASLTFAVLLFAYFFSQFFRSFLTIIAADLSRDLGFGPEELGWISSSWFIAFAVSQFPVGYLLDTAGPRRTMGGLMAVGVVGAFLFAASPGFAVSALGMALVGIGCSPMLMASLYIFGRTEPPARFATLSSAFVGLGIVGVLAAATPLTLAAAAFGWRASMAGAGVAMAGATVLVLLLLKDPPPAQRSDGAAESFLAGLATLLRIRALWLVFPLHLVSYGAVATERGLWVGPFLDKVHGLGPLDRGNAVALMSLAMGAGALASGPAARLLGGTKRPAEIGNAITAALFLALAALPWLGAGAATMLLVGIGFFGLTYSLLLSHGRPFIPDHLLGRGVTLLNFLAIGGAGLMQALSGRLMDRLLDGGASQASAFATIHAAIGMIVIVALVPFLLARKTP
jgi:MFS family permease